MPVSVSRPKRKSRGDPETSNSGGGLAPPEKENGAPATKKKKREDGAEKPPAKKQKKKATQAPVQNDDGFIFRTRTTRSSKAAETAQSTQTALSSSSSSQPPPVQDAPKPRASKKRTITPPSQPEEPKKAKATQGKGKKAHPPGAADEKNRGWEEGLMGGENREKVDKGVSAPLPSQTLKSGSGDADATKVVLPMSDTPIIRRNQQLRKGGGAGNRRSSVGMRGRRANSLMDTGVIAEPHAEVVLEDFYKHIHDELLEPQRMKQLLSWCGRRALTPAGTNDKDFNARTISRIIEEELLADVLSNAELSSWFNRDDSVPSNVVKKPNPRNAESLAKVEECQVHLKRLQDEKTAWQTLLKSASGLSLNPSINLFDTTLYSPAESSFAASLSQSQSADLVGNAKRLVKQHNSEIEFQVDQIVDGIHRLQQYGESADRLGGRVLEAAEWVLAEREREVMISVGTDGLPLKEVLRSLSRLDR